MVSSAEIQLMNDNSQPENDKEASGGDSPKVRVTAHHNKVQKAFSNPARVHVFFLFRCYCGPVTSVF